MFSLSRRRNFSGVRQSGIPVLLVALSVALVSPSSVMAQDLQALLDRIDRLERDIRTLNVQVSRSEGASATVAAAEGATEGANSVATGSASPAGMAHLDARITSMENDLRTVTGSVEELGYQINQLTSRIEKLVGDVDFRLSELEQGRSSGGFSQQTQPISQGNGQGDGLIAQDGSNTPQPVTAQGSQGTGVLGTISADQLANIGSGENDQVTAAPSSSGTLSAEELAAPAPAAASETTEIAALTPQDAYAEAFALLRQAKYDEAAVALQSFVDEHSDHELASNARYWLGETYYVRSEFVRAAEVFFQAYRDDPQGPKASDTLLKLGMALSNLGKPAEACAAFSKLTQEYPNPSPAIVTKLERERVRNECGG